MLKLFNSNTESPYLIWDNRTRAELKEYVSMQQTSHIRSVSFILRHETFPIRNCFKCYFLQGESDPTYGAEFVFDTLRDELVIGDIYVRIYNEQPTFVLYDARSFAAHLLSYLENKSQYLHSLTSLTDSNTSLRDGEIAPSSAGSSSQVTNAQMALKALANVIRTNTGILFCSF